MTSPARDVSFQPVPREYPESESRILSTLAGIATVLLFITVVFAITWWEGRFVVTNTTTYVVQPGDTVDRIASRYDPDVDVRKPRDWIIQHNDLGNGPIQPGQILRVPIEGRG